MIERMRISAKKLGGLNMPDFCPRCFWIRAHMRGEPPFSIFPQVFGHIDRYTKKVVHGYLDEVGEAPSWLKELGKITGYIDPPNPDAFQMMIDDNVLLTGEADAILVLNDGKLVIADYKTAFPKGDDDHLYAMYLVQLNAYALLAEYLDLGTVDSLSLVYTKPMTGDASARLKANRRDDGFCLGFSAELLKIPLDKTIVPKLAKKAWEIYSEPTCPVGRIGCRECRQAEEMQAMAKKVKASYASIK